MTVAMTGGALVGLPQAEAANGAGGCYFSAAEPLLKSGARGAAVKQMQCEYNAAARAYPAIGGQITADGIFGPRTKNAIIALQKFSGGGRGWIQTDGIVGPQTWAKLNALSRGKTAAPGNPADRDRYYAEQAARARAEQLISGHRGRAVDVFRQLVAKNPLTAEQEMRAYCRPILQAYYEAERRNGGLWGNDGGGGGSNYSSPISFCQQF
ncbi:MAG: peptidoglycan-binding domain-containing protein [Propionibacteriaceae bacterium]|nr:peptidoglycan-binding domain-containing protein [Propionibacteriaceae bacterium]